ncbi:MAG: nucleotidyltransferase domain-containing protein [bacterium]
MRPRGRLPSPDSDLDLKAIHGAHRCTAGARTAARHARSSGSALEGVEIDYTSNEVGPALAGILRGNGNFLERVLGCTAL